MVVKQLVHLNIKPFVGVGTFSEFELSNLSQYWWFKVRNAQPNLNTEKYRKQSKSLYLVTDFSWIF